MRQAIEQRDRLNTLVNIQSPSPAFDGRFPVGLNTRNLAMLRDQASSLQRKGNTEVKFAQLKLENAIARLRVQIRAHALRVGRDAGTRFESAQLGEQPLEPWCAVHCAVRDFRVPIRLRPARVPATA